MTSQSDAHPPIRAIVARFTWPPAQAVIENVLQKRPFVYAAFIAEKPHVYSGLAEDAQDFFASSEIRGCKYQGIDWSTIAPLDTEIIEAMRDTEDVFMDTVSRLEWKRDIPYAVRKRWYLQHLRFWNDYLTRHTINLFLSAWIPHEVPDVILYRLCRFRGIPTLYFHTTLVQDISFAASTWEDPAPRFHEAYEKLSAEFAQTTAPEDVSLEPLFEERYQSLIIEKAERPAVEKMHRNKELERVKSLLKCNPPKFFWNGIRYLSPSGISRLYGILQRRSVIRDRDAYYTAHAVRPDMNREFVYLPLHFQPEASTTPMAGVFTDQLLIAQMLNACLPDTVLIYLKEHPRQSSWTKRTKRDYEQLVAIEKVRLIARDVDTFALREKCKAVATCTGTAGFEALFRNKPVFLFGSRFYQYVRGVFRIRTTEDCQKAVQTIFTEGVTPNLIDARILLKAMEQSGVRALLHPLHAQILNLNEAEHIANNTKAILEELDAHQIGSVT